MERPTQVAATTLWMTLGVLCIGEGLCYLFDQDKITTHVHKMLDDGLFMRLFVWTFIGFGVWHFLVEGELQHHKNKYAKINN